MAACQRRGSELGGPLFARPIRCSRWFGDAARARTEGGKFGSRYLSPRPGAASGSARSSAPAASARASRAAPAGLGVVRPDRVDAQEDEHQARQEGGNGVVPGQVHLLGQRVQQAPEPDGRDAADNQPNAFHHRPPRLSPNTTPSRRLTREKATKHDEPCVAWPVGCSALFGPTSALRQRIQIVRDSLMASVRRDFAGCFAGLICPLRVSSLLYQEASDFQMTVSRRRMKHGSIKTTRLVRIIATVRSYFDSVQLAPFSSVLNQRKSDRSRRQQLVSRVWLVAQIFAPDV